MNHWIDVKREKKVREKLAYLVDSVLEDEGIYAGNEIGEISDEELKRIYWVSAAIMLRTSKAVAEGVL